MVTIGKSRGRAPSLLLSFLLCFVLACGLGASAPALALNLSGAVALDANGNGLVDAADSALPGIAVSVQPAAGGVTASTTTAANGTFIFSGLAAGTYNVTVGSSPGVLGETPSTQTVQLATDRNDVSFLFVAPGLIGGRVVSDLNNNGIADPNEPGLAGVQLDLQRLNTQGAFALAASATTGSDGTFFFPLQQAGTFVVIEHDPAGAISTGANAGLSGTGVVVDPNTIRIILNGSQSAAGLRFVDRSTAVGGVSGGAISGFVFQDVNSNGAIDPGLDQGVVTAVELRDAAQNLLATTMTAADGSYSFTSVAPGGTYVIRVVPPAGSVIRKVFPTPPATTAGSTGILIQGFNPATSYANQNFLLGSTPVVSPETPGAANAISGKVFNDLNGDGLVSGNEPGLAGATLTLVSTTSVSFGTTVTNGSGEFTFVNLPAGDYVLTETDPAGFVSTGVQPGVGGSTLSLNQIRVHVTGTNNLFSGHIFLDRAVGIPSPPPTTTGVISGSVFRDVNGNNFIDLGDAPLANVRVVIQNAQGGFLAQTFTNVNGAWAFGNVSAGTYRIVEVDPANFVSVAAFAGAGGFVLDANTIQVTLPAGGSSVNNNFLDRSVVISPTVGSISGSVFQDLNGNSVIDGGDAPLAGVLVQLFTQNGTFITQRTTDAIGAYAFNDQPPGFYRVRQVVSANFVAVAAIAGQNGQVLDASDLLVTINAGFNSGNNNFLDRFVVVSPAVGSISGAVFRDDNNNTFIDAGDTRLAGVTIRLFDGLGNFIRQMLTDNNGGYLFINLPPGTYRVVEVDPLNVVSVGAAAGPGSTVIDANTIQVTVASGFNSGNNLFLDRLFVTPSPPPTGVNTISGFAVRDTNLDRSPNGEPGLANMTVTLRDAFNNMIGTAVTDVTGAFSFTGVGNGTFTLIATPPFGLTSTNAIAGVGGTALSVNSIRVVTSPGNTNYNAHLFLAGP
jgi:hypothetical protein